MQTKNEPSQFTTSREAAEALVNRFISEVGTVPSGWTDEYLAKFTVSFTQDGHLPNEYELEALVGAVPLDDDDPEGDYGCPEEVTAKFPRTSKLIEDQF